jgi:MFS family permease
MTATRRTIALILAHALLTQVLTYAMRPTLTYAVLDLGDGGSRLGLIVAAFAAPAAVLAIPAGHLVDRWGPRSVLVVGAGFFVLAAFTAASAGGSYAVLVTGTCLLGAAHTFSVVGDQSMLSRLVGPGLVRRFGWYGFAAALGQTVGPGLLTLTGSQGAIPAVRPIFAMCAVGAVAMVALSATMSAPRKSPVAVALPSDPSSSLQLLRRPGMPRALITGSLVIASVDLFYGFLPAIGYAAGFSAQAVGFVLMARSVATMLSRIAAPAILPRVGSRRFLTSAVVVSALSLLLMTAQPPLAWLIVLALAFGFSNGACQPLTMSWVSSLAPPARQGLAVSLRVTGNRISQTAVPLALTPVAAFTGAGGVLAATAVTLCGAAWTARAVVDLGPPRTPADRRA